MAEEGDPWIRRRTAPMRFAPQNKNKVTVSLPEAVAVKEDKLKLFREQINRQNRPSFAVQINKALPTGRSSSKSPSASSTRSPLALSSRSPRFVLPPNSPRPTSEEFPIKVLQTPISLFEFKAATKFDILTALSMKMTRRPLNVYGEPCAPLSLQDDCLEVEVVPEPKGPAGSEYGQKGRLAARKLRLKRRRKFSNDNPKLDMVKEEVSLKVQDEMAHKHRMKGYPRKMNDISGSYYVLIPDEGAGTYHAHPVKDWCSFGHINKAKTLTVEEAEETFQKRDKILNLFSVMVAKRLKEGLQGEGEEDDDCVVVKDTRSKKQRKVEDSQDSDVEIMEEGDSNDSDY